MSLPPSPVLTWGLKLACSLGLAGKAYHHLFFDPPYRALLWNQSLMERPVRWLIGWDWTTYIESARADQLIQGGIQIIGLLFLLCAVAALFADRKRPWIKGFLGLATALLLLLAICIFTNKQYQLPQLLEQVLQTCTPLFLWFWVYRGPSEKLWHVMRLGIALTFIGHGLYAMGTPYAVPGHFIDMFIRTLGVTETFARGALLAAGILDLAVAVGLFIPRLTRYAAAYAMVWGFLTAAARLSSYVRFDPLFWSSLHQWHWQFWMRVPHFMIPWLLWRWERLRRKNQDQAKVDHF